MGLHEDLIRENFGKESHVKELSPLKPSTHRLYKVVLADQSLIVKLYDHHHRSDARREAAGHGLFSHLPFVVKLSHMLHKAGYTLLGYEWIDGQNISDFFGTNRGSVLAVREKILLEVIDHITHMLRVSLTHSVRPGTPTLSFRNPLLKGLLTFEEEDQFRYDYDVVQKVQETICARYPGLFLDRNPGNIVFSPKDQRIYQVDFGCLEQTSPMFDLVQLLRTFSGEPTFIDQDTDPDMYVPLYWGNIEKDIVDYAFFHMQHVYGELMGTKEDFYRHFLYAAFRFHIYYLTKAFGRIRDGDEYMRVQKGRIPYHARLLEETFCQLMEMHEPVSRLRVWVDRFTHFSSIM